MDEVAEIETDLLLQAIERRYGYDFRGYAGASLRRRVKRAMAQEDCATISALQERLLHDPDSLGRFIAAMSVGVTEMFRDAQMYRYLRESVIPLLKTYPFVRIWHAGCATGEEVYSMAILLHEEGLLDRCRLYGTDLSVDALRTAKRGIYSVDRIEASARAYASAGGTGDFSRYYQITGDSAVMASFLRSRLVFSQHNLVSDSSFNEFQLIFCRNVLIYFGEELTNRVMELLSDSLVRFGVLVLGLRESVRFTKVADSFEDLEPSLRVYRKVR